MFSFRLTQLRLVPLHSIQLRLLAAFMLVACLSACNVKVSKDENGKDKNVDIDTPVASIHVSKNGNSDQTGLPVYPGAHVINKDSDGDDKRANVNISSGFFGLKVIAVEYHSDDPVEKIVAYYRDQLKRYGNIVQCRNSGTDVSMHYGDDSKNDSKNDPDKLKCEESNGNNYELKAGTRNNQRIVSVEPQDKGSKFTLVYVQTHGKDTI